MQGFRHRWYATDSFVCIGVHFPRVFLCVVGAHGIFGISDLVKNLVVELWRNLPIDVLSLHVCSSGCVALRGYGSVDARSIFVRLVVYLGVCSSLQGDVDAGLVRLVYQHEKSGWFSSPNASDGFLSTAQGGSSSDVLGLLVIEMSDFLLFGDGITPRSTSIRHVGAPDELIMVPLKIFDVLHREGGRLHRWQLRPSAMGTIGNTTYRCLAV